MTIYNSKDNGGLWIQPNGPNTKPEYLGCHSLDDIAIDKGGTTLAMCINADGKFDVTGWTEDVPKPIKTSLSFDIQRPVDFLETVACPYPLHVNLRCQGKADVFTNWERGWILPVMKSINETLSGLVARDASNKAEYKVDVEILPPLIGAYRLNVTRQSTYEVKDALDIFIVPDQRCASACGPAIAQGDDAFFVTEVLAASSTTTGNVQFTSTGGQAWAAGATDPFAAGKAIASGVCFQIGQNTWRYLVAIGTTSAGVAMKVAYSDNAGATWTTVTVGSVLGQYAVKAKTLFAYNSNNIWLVCTGGYVYFSSDAGLTWTAQSSGGVTAQNLLAVHFPKGDRLNGWAVGAANAILKTTDGGATGWTSVTGPVAQAAVNINGVFALSNLRVWLAYNDGKIYFTNDGGATWTQRTYPGSASGVAMQIQFADDYNGYLIHNTTAPLGELYQTRDGGYTWELVPLTGSAALNTGFNAMDVASPRLLYICGDVYGGTAFIARATPIS